MATRDNIQPAYPNNTHKQDWAYYPFVGGRGGGATIPNTVVTRYSFWIDFDPFDIKNLKMLSQNISFQIYKDNQGNVPAVPYFVVDQSNDITDELITANLPTTPGGSIAVGSATINYPPSGFVDTGQGFAFSGVPPTSSSVPAPTSPAAGSSTGGGLAANTTYWYVATAVVGGVEGLGSTPVSATTDSSNLSVGFAFNPVPNADYYNIYRNSTSNFSTGNLLYMNNYYDFQPPYYVNTNFTSQPTNTSFRNDQGSRTLKGFKGRGVSFGQTNMVGQGFIPQQSQLTGFFLGDLFHTNTQDHTTFGAINIELWDSNKTFYKHLVTLQPTLTAKTTTAPTGLITDSSGTAYCNSIDYNFGDDGNNYWIQLKQLGIQLATPVSLTVGQKYYIVVRLQTLTAANYYALGGNYDASGVRDPLYYYPFAEAIQATDGSSTFSTLVDNNSNQITFPFVTQGNVGRYAVTFWWGNLGGTNTYWYAPPTSKEYAFLHVDYNTRI